MSRTPQQSRSRSVRGAVTTALEQLIDRVSDVGEISVRAVAERAGVGIGSVYDYFNGQDGVFADFIGRINGANFATLEAVLEQSRGQSLEVALRTFFDRALGLYLDNPRRTRIALGLIARVGAMALVIGERDRFAEVVVRRIREDRPELDQRLVQRTIRLTFDAVVGAVIAELWRPTEGLREDLLELVDAHLQRQLGVRIARG